MGYKDTVKRYQKKHEVVTGSSEWHMIDGYNMGAKAQAEITWKARDKEIDEACKAGYMDGYPDGFKDGGKVGIKEVVEWVEKKMWVHNCDELEVLALWEADWIDQLTEWGIVMPPEEHSPDPSFHHNKNVSKSFSM